MNEFCSVCSVWTMINRIKKILSSFYGNFTAKKRGDKQGDCLFSCDNVSRPAKRSIFQAIILLAMKQTWALPNLLALKVKKKKKKFETK